MNGLSALYFDAQKIRQQAESVKAMIWAAPDKFKELWGSEDTISKIGKDNFDVINALKNTDAQNQFVRSVFDTKHFIPLVRQ